MRALLFLSLLALGCTSSDPPADLRVLFIGNSLTYENDLPAVVERILETDGIEVSVETLAEPNYALEDHWNGRRALRMIRSGQWDVVVMQQGPSSLDDSREHLIAWSKRFAEEVREAGSRPMLMTVWPPAGRIEALPRVVNSYAIAATGCSCELAPAGRAWLEVFLEDPGVRLYGLDGFHPSTEGTALAALVTAATIRGWETVPESAFVASALDGNRRQFYLKAVGDARSPAHRR